MDRPARLGLACTPASTAAPGSWWAGRWSCAATGDEAIACVEAAVLARGIQPGQLTLGTDNGSQFTSRDFRKHLSARGITHRRGGYRDPESQAFIASWFGQFKQRLAWRSQSQWESLEQASKEIPGYIDAYHQRPHSGLAYRTPAEVAATWRPDPDLRQTRAT